MQTAEQTAAHTPGPWHSDATVSFHDRPDLPCVVDQFRLVVAQCWDDGHSADECEANASLISAAPELLAALKSSVGAMEVLGHPANYGALAKANAAIAKAEGR